MTGSTAHSHRYDAVVIGAGHNGLTCAAMLAKKGRRVLLLERRAVVGGLAVGDEFHPGSRAIGLYHDTSMLRPGVVDALDLARFGLRRATEPEPIFAPQEAGPGLLLHHDPQKASAELRGVSDHDATRYAEFRAFLSRLSKLTGRWLDEPPPDIRSTSFGATMKLLSKGLALRRLGRRDMMEVLRIAPMCAADWLGEWFDSELVKSVLARPAVMAMMTGPRSPGTAANVIREESAAKGAVFGGPNAIIAALEAAARHHGVEIRTAADVARINVAADRTSGVSLADGETIEAAVVAASCDPKTTFLRLVHPRDLPLHSAKAFQDFRMRGTTAKVNLALRGPLRFACRPELDVTRAWVGETLNTLERAYDAVKYRRFSDRPVLDVRVDELSAATQSDKDDGPKTTPTTAEHELAHVVSIIAQFAPYDLDGGWTDAARQRLGDVIVAELARYAPDAAGLIVGREVLTPVDIENRYGVTGGHIHHGEHGLDQLLVRPSLECAQYDTPIQGLFLCGSGCHPGGGLSCAPGALAAGAILNHRD